MVLAGCWTYRTGALRKGWGRGRTSRVVALRRVPGMVVPGVAAPGMIGGLLWLAIGCVLASTTQAQVVGRPIWVGSFVQAQEAAARLGRPILAIAVGEGCPPCHQLRHVMRTDAQLQATLGNAVVLEMDSSGQEFSGFRQAYPQGFEGSIPMVYLIDPSRQVRYARAGFIPPQSLSQLVEQTVQAHGQPLTEEEAQAHAAALASAEGAVQGGRLVEAYQWLRPIARRRGAAQSIVRAQRHRENVASQLRATLAEYDENLQGGNQPYESAFRVAEMYVQLRHDPELQSQARAILDRHGTRDETQRVVLQAKYLVRARVAEARRDSGMATESYRSILAIDRGSPIGIFAARRLPELDGSIGLQ